MYEGMKWTTSHGAGHGMRTLAAPMNNRMARRHHLSTGVDTIKTEPGNERRAEGVESDRSPVGVTKITAQPLDTPS